MNGNCRSIVAMVCAVVVSAAGKVPAQQVTVGAPAIGMSDSFHENIGVGFGFRLPGGGFFHHGGPNGFAGGGAGLRSGGPNGYLTFVADQGSSRSMSMVSPSVTVMNGGTGAIYDVTWRPFVVGFTPVVGGLADPAFAQFGPLPIAAIPGPTMLEQRWGRLQESGGLTGLAAGQATGSGVSAVAGVALPIDPQAAKLAAARESSAGRPLPSIAAIRQQQAEQDAAQAREIAETLDRARRAEAEKNLGVARIYYQQALRRSTGKQHDEIAAKLRSLGSGTK